MVQAAVLLGLLALPAAGIHGILRYGAFDIAEATADRSSSGRRRPSSPILYGIAVAAPACCSATGSARERGAPHRGLGGGSCPAGAGSTRAIRRAVLGDRDHHLALLSELGARLEQTVDLDEVLTGSPRVA